MADQVYLAKPYDSAVTGESAALSNTLIFKLKRRSGNFVNTPTRATADEQGRFTVVTSPHLQESLRPAGGLPWTPSSSPTITRPCDHAMATSPVRRSTPHSACGLNEGDRS